MKKPDFVFLYYLQVVILLLFVFIALDFQRCNFFICWWFRF